MYIMAELPFVHRYMTRRLSIYVLQLQGDNKDLATEVEETTKPLVSDPLISICGRHPSKRAMLHGLRV